MCSDHGFGGAGEHVLYLNNFLQQNGWLTSKRESRLAPLRQKIAKSVPHSILGKVSESPCFDSRRVESRARYGESILIKQAHFPMR